MTQTEFETEAIAWDHIPKPPIVQWQNAHRAVGYPATALGTAVLVGAVVGLAALAAVVLERVRSEHEPAPRRLGFRR